MQKYYKNLNYANLYAKNMRFATQWNNYSLLATSPRIVALDTATTVSNGRKQFSFVF